MTRFIFLLKPTFAIAALLAVATNSTAEIPPAPPGYGSESEIKLAFLAGKLEIIDMDLPAPDTVSVEKGVQYGQGGKTPLLLDLYSPKDRSQPAPAVIFIHGGAWKSGNREVYHYYCAKFAERGYVAATVSYRLSAVAPFPAAVEDVKCAVRWLRANAERLGVDPDRIAAAGGSAGGHLSMMLGYAADAPELEGAGGHSEVSSRVQAIVNLYGPTDLTTDFAKSSDAVRQFLGGKTFAEDRKLYELASPVTHVTEGDAPTLILHGSIDTVVPIDQAEILAAKLKQAQVPFEYDRVEGWPHTMDLSADVNRHCLAMMFAFFDKHLAPAKPSSDAK